MASANPGRRVLERDGRACVVCGSTENLRVHRLIGVADGGSNDDANLVTLCEPCHLDEHRRAEDEQIGEDYMLYGEL